MYYGNDRWEYYIFEAFLLQSHLFEVYLSDALCQEHGEKPRGPTELELTCPAATGPWHMVPPGRRLGSLRIHPLQAKPVVNTGVYGGVSSQKLCW